MSLTVTIESDPSCFSRLSDEWLALLPNATTNTLFQTPQFLATWWKTLGFGTLNIVTFRTEKNQLVGLAPFFVQPTSEGKKQLCMVGCVNVSDYLDVVVHSEFQTEVFETLGNVINTQIEWDEIFWCSIPEHSPTRLFLKNLFSQTQETIQDVSPYIELPQTWDDYLSSLERKQRHEVKRKLRRLEELPYQVQLITNESDAQQAVEEFIALHKASSAEKRDFWNEAHLVFFRELVPAAAKLRWLRLFFLEIKEKKVAAMLIFDYNNIYNLYNSGFIPDVYREIGTGTVLTALTIKHAIEAKKILYDFLRGDEPYKFRLGGKPQNVYDLNVVK